MTRTPVIILALTALAAPTAAAGSGSVANPDPAPTCVVPDLKYSTQADAVAALSVGRLCRLGTVTKRYPRRHGHANRCPRHTKLIVTHQTPKPYVHLPTFGKVSITLTCGKQPVA